MLISLYMVSGNAEFDIIYHGQLESNQSQQMDHVGHSQLLFLSYTMDLYRLILVLIAEMQPLYVNNRMKQQRKIKQMDQIVWSGGKIE